MFRCTAICCSCRRRRRMGASIAARRESRCRRLRHRLLRRRHQARLEQLRVRVRRSGQPGPVPRRAHFRYQRHGESQAGGRRAELPRIAHAHAGDRPEGSRTTSTSISPAPAMSVRLKNWRGAPAETPDKNPDTALFRIDIIKVPLAHPELAKIVSSPRIFSRCANRRHQRPLEGRQSRRRHADHVEHR